MPLTSCLQRYNKEAIIAHHWLDRILPDGALFLASSLFPMALRIGAPSSIVFPMDFRHSASASRHPAKAPWLVSSSAAAPWPASPLQLLGQHLRCSALAGQLLRRSAPASNKPHLAEKRTPVWLAIWHTWAGFANSQHRDAAFATPDNICAHSSLLPHWAAAQTDANLSAHLHRLPTPPPYLRQMRLLPGQMRRSCKSPRTLPKCKYLITR